MIYETAVGDAYGLGWEFASGKNIQTAPNDLSGYHVNPRYPEYPVGHYTDDTLRSIANSIVVLGDKEHWFDPLSYIAAYQAVHAVDNRQGWSRGFQAHLEAHGQSTPLEFMLSLRRRATNGAVMGVAVLGHLPDENSVRMATIAQCVSTHSGSTIPAAQAVALAAHYLIYDKGPRDQIEAHLESQVDWTDEECRQILCRNQPIPAPAMPAWTIAAGALFLLTDSTFSGLSERLKFAIKRGGDTDSLGAVAMALCTCAHDIPNDLPNSLVENLEDEDGRQMLREIDEKLRNFVAEQI